MVRTLKNIAIVLIVVLLIGSSATLLKDIAHINQKDNENIYYNDQKEKLIGGTKGFCTDFSGNMRLRMDGANCVKLNTVSDDNIYHEYPSPLIYESSHAELKVNNEELEYFCFLSGYDSDCPKLKFKPLESNEKLYLNEFKVLTVDFDLWYSVSNVEYSNKFKALFNIRSEASDSSVTDINCYYNFVSSVNNSSGRGHYTFVLNNTGDEYMEITVYKDGVLVYAISDFLTADYDASDFYVSCLNLELPMDAGDEVGVDNVQFYIFDNDYDGAIIDLVENPDVNLKYCKDSVLYCG